MSLERIDKQLAQINQQIIATKEKIELFNSDDMMKKHFNNFNQVSKIKRLNVIN